jgi:hypothetical protein
MVEVTERKIHELMTHKATQEELKAATNATLRAHATSDEAKTLVATLVTMVDERALAVGLRKNKAEQDFREAPIQTGA